MSILRVSLNRWWSNYIMEYQATVKKNEMALPQGRVPRHQLLNDETTDRLVYTVGTFCIKQGVEMKINICIFLEMHKGTKWLPRWRWEPGKVFELENHVPPRAVGTRQTGDRCVETLPSESSYIFWILNHVNMNPFQNIALKKKKN